MDKNLNTDFTENTDLTFSLIFLVGKCFLDFYQDFRGFASACGTPFSLANEHQPPLVLPRRGDAGYSGSVKDWLMQVTLVLSKTG